MIELISRPIALENLTFASVIHNWQQRFDPRIDPYRTEPGNYFDNAIDGQRYFSREEIDSIHKKEIAEYELLRDRIDPITLVDHEELIFNLSFMDITVYSIELGKAVQKLSGYLNSKITFLLDYRIPWLSQDNDFKPVKNALNYLKEIGMTDQFVGGIRADGDELAELTSHLFWIMRCNAALPYGWFALGSEPFVGNICKYGNLHFDTYNESIKIKLIQFAEDFKFISIEHCVENFNNNGIIYGRETML